MPADVLARLCAPASDPRPAPRTLIVCAHPDDEVLGAGGRLARLASGLHLVHLTDGAPREMGDARREGFARREDYAAARRREVERALGLVGVPLARAVGLGAVDQEASHDLASLARRTAEVVLEVAPEAVLAPAYEGGHPDHDAAAFVAQAACRAAASQAEGSAPPVIEFPLYHAPAEGAGPHEFLPARGGGPEVVVELSPAEQAMKRRLVECHRTQAVVIAGFPLERERFRTTSGHDFTRPPHEGPLHYEGQPWGMTGERWRALAAQALAALESGA